MTSAISTIQRAQFAPWLLPLVMAAAAGFSYWLWRVNVSPPGVLPPPQAPRIDAFATRLSVTALDQTGATHYRLNAARLVHYSENAGIEITSPAMRIFAPAQPEVTAHAQRGSVNGDGTVIELYGDARIERESGSSEPAMTATSQYFQLLVKSDTVQTGKPVRLQYGESVAHANGMIYNNATRIVQLAGQVQGKIFVPK